jgi:hypothetical protein
MTFFQGITTFLLLLTLAVGALRLRTDKGRVWRLVYYLLPLLFGLGMSYSLKPWLVLAGAVFAWFPKLKWAETIVLAYIAVRCAGLLLGWPDFF